MDKEGANFHQEEMRYIRERANLKKVIKKMQSIIALNNPPFPIFEEWQTNDLNDRLKNKVETEGLEEKISEIQPLTRLFSILQGACTLFFLWLISTSIVFRTNMPVETYLAIIVL